MKPISLEKGKTFTSESKKKTKGTDDFFIRVSSFFLLRGDASRKREQRGFAQTEHGVVFEMNNVPSRVSDTSDSCVNKGSRINGILNTTTIFK